MPANLCQATHHLVPCTALEEICLAVKESCDVDAQCEGSDEPFSLPVDTWKPTVLSEVVHVHLTDCAKLATTKLESVLRLGAGR